MVFSSLPGYLDPANWQQQQPTNTTGASGSSQLLPPPPPPPQPQQPQPPPAPHGAGSSSIRPGSMAERARLANVPMPETALKCPRCESTNTKFCYFNNYSLSQPRHFCKTCRRYWTRGGALRNVPVGGGCRRNKRSKGSSSSTSTSSKSQDSTSTSNTSGGGVAPGVGPTSSLSSLISSYNSSILTGHHHDHILGLGGSSLPPPRLMAPLHHQQQLSTDHFTNTTDSIGLNYAASAVSAPLGGTNTHDLSSFHIGSGSGGGGSLLSGLDQWRFQTQLPLLGSLNISSSSGLYPFEAGGMESGYGGTGSGNLRPKMFAPSSSSGLVSAATTQMASIKVEDNHELNLSRQFLGNDQQFWNLNATGTSSSWSDLSNFSSSSTSNPL